MKPISQEAFERNMRVIADALAEESDFRKIRRYAGIIEGYLITGGIKETGTQFEYEDIEEENPSIFAPWFPGTAKTVIRKERYDELMLRWAREYIEACEDVPQ